MQKDLHSKSKKSDFACQSEIIWKDQIYKKRMHFLNVFVVTLIGYRGAGDCLASRNWRSSNTETIWISQNQIQG